VIGKDLKNPIPEWAQNGADRKFVAYDVAPNMNTPHPDPGEEFPHINTYLFGIQDTKNRFMPLARMVAPGRPVLQERAFYQYPAQRGG
jgi:phospholipase C